MGKWTSTLIAWIRPPWEARLRKEMQAQPLTFRTSVEVKVGAVDPMQAVREQLNPSVYADAFEVSHPFPLFRLLNGKDYPYRAPHSGNRWIPTLRSRSPVLG